MKKIVGTIAAIALAASSAFAGANFGMGFNRGVWAPFALSKTGDTTTMGMLNTTNWGWGGPRIGASFSAASEDIGVVGDVKFDGGKVKVNDNAYIWVKPASWLKIQLGQSFDETLRGNACFGSWDWLRAGSILGEDLTFRRISKDANTMSEPMTGAIVMLDPIEGLHVAAGFPIAYASLTNYESVFKNIQVQAGYTITDVMQIKAQWRGTGDEYGIINAAVSLKAVENMTLDVGAYFNTKPESDIVIAAFWGMPFGAVSVNANAEVTIPTNAGNNASMKAGVGVGVDCGNGISVAGDVRIGQEFTDNAKTAITASVMANKGVANGSIGIGVQAAFNDDFGGITGMKKDKDNGIPTPDMNIAIPVMFQCFF